MIGAYPTFRACEVSTAATLTFRSASRDSPPETAVNASVKAGCQAITSRMSSGRSTLGSIACSRSRRSVRLAGSGTASMWATCSFPSASTRTSVLTTSRPATSR
jgi:hypothetical protein